MSLPLRRALYAAAATTAVAASAYACFSRSLSTAAPRPPWAMIYHTPQVRSPGPRASFQFAEPPGASNLLVPDHLFERRPSPDPDSDLIPLLGGSVCSTSGDGLLLLAYCDSHATAPIFCKPDGTRERRLMAPDMNPDITRFVCNPITGELFRLPDIDGTKKTVCCHNIGILTRSAAGQGPPDRYAVATLSQDHHGEQGTFVMRRFLSQTGEWEKLVGLPSPLPFPRRFNIYLEAVACGGRLWWVDLTWGAISADPFSDRPELRFVELPRGSVCPPLTNTRQIQVPGMSRRMGVSEGRLRYVEMSQEPPFLLSSYALDDNGSCWTLEHQVVLEPLLANGSHLSQQKHSPRIGVIDPVNASSICILVGKSVLAVDMDKGAVTACSPVDENEGPAWVITTCLKPCLLPEWLGSSRIPAAGAFLSKEGGPKGKALSEILLRADSDKKN